MAFFVFGDKQGSLSSAKDAALRYLPISPNTEKTRFEQTVGWQIWKEHIRELIRSNKGFSGVSWKIRRNWCGC